MSNIWRPGQRSPGQKLKLPKELKILRLKISMNKKLKLNLNLYFVNETPTGQPFLPVLLCHKSSNELFFDFFYSCQYRCVYRN